MAKMYERFECIREPTDSWMIWDRHHGRPAEIHGTVFVGLKRERAVSFCLMLNMLTVDNSPQSIAS